MPSDLMERVTNPVYPQNVIKALKQGVLELF